MEDYILLLISIFSVVFTYSIARNNKGSVLYNQFPDKFLIKNRFILNYLFNPKNKVTIWFFVLHLMQLGAFFLVIILYILYWTNVIDLVSLKLTSIIYLIYFIITHIIIFTIHWIKHKEYIK